MILIDLFCAIDDFVKNLNHVGKHSTWDALPEE